MNEVIDGGGNGGVFMIEPDTCNVSVRRLEGDAANLIHPMSSSHPRNNWTCMLVFSTNFSETVPDEWKRIGVPVQDGQAF